MPGDTITLKNTLTYTGIITSSTSSIRFTIPFSKSLAKIKKVEIFGNFVLRGIKGYIDESNTNTITIDSNLGSTYKLTCYIGTDNSVLADIRKSSAYDNTQNNTIVGIDIEKGAIIEFS